MQEMDVMDIRLLRALPLNLIRWKFPSGALFAGSFAVLMFCFRGTIPSAFAVKLMFRPKGRGGIRNAEQTSCRWINRGYGCNLPWLQLNQ
jgi:hypothetical protein